MIRALLVLVLLAGCASPRLALDERWRPLVAVVEADLPFAPDGSTVTIGTRCYVADLADWEARYPEGPVRDALLLHEQAHAIRQGEGGLGWLARYLADPAFAWSEEQVGWAAELRHLRDHGRLDRAEVYAAILARYRVPGGELVSYEDALAWVRHVLTSP